MAKEKRNPLIRSFEAACRPPDRRPPWQWCENHLIVDNSSPFPGYWRSANSPWVKPVMEAFASNTVRNIAVRCAAQTAKTQTAIGCLCWAISESPGPGMWVTSTRTEMREFASDRLERTFAQCLPVQQLLVTNDSNRAQFVGMSLYYAWAGSKHRLQSKPIRWLFCDEVRNYAPGRVEMVLKRTRTYWNCCRFLLSTAGEKGDAIDRAFQDGNQNVWHFRCPYCSAEQPLKFEHLKYDTNDVTKPGGRRAAAALAATLRYERAARGAAIHDT
ncbi:MAG: phage terminase large subunit family protein, partial [Armatimonadetes bacterium]|nr:phage terminase large subunit family protein [Armatimonadota bacterium]